MNKLTLASVYVSPIALVCSGTLFIGQYGIQKIEKYVPDVKTEQLKLKKLADSYYHDIHDRYLKSLRTKKPDPDAKLKDDEKSFGDSPITCQMNKWARGIIAFVMLAGANNGIKAGKDENQPSMVLGCVLDALAAPLNLRFSQQQMQGLASVTIGAFDSGFANTYSQYGSQANKSIQLSIKPLFSKKMLKQVSFPGASKNHGHKWMQYAKRVGYFILQDQKRVYDSFWHVITYPFKTSLSKWPEIIGRHSKEIIQFLKKPRAAAVPYVFKPHATMLRFATSLLYIGSIPLIVEEFLGHKRPAKNNDGSHPSSTVKASRWLLGTSYTLSSLARMAIGWKIKNTREGKVLLIGMPMSIIAPVIMNNFGIGLGQLGQAASHYYFIRRPKG